MNINQRKINRNIYFDREVNLDANELFDDKTKKRRSNFSRSNFKLYFGYNFRVFLYSIIMVVFFVLALFLFFKSIDVLDSESISYQENSDLDYKVYLKKNNFYDADYLGKDMMYIANLIDKIVIDFKYFFNIDQAADIKFSYDVIAKLSIIDDVEKKIYYEKNFDLLSNKEYRMINKTSYDITEKVTIDYDYYNSLANNFRKSYGVNAVSNLVIYLKINKINGENTGFKLNNDSEMSLSIPLSKKSINIEMQYNKINKSSYLTKEKSISLNSTFLMLLAVICLIFGFIFVVKVFKLLFMLFPKKSIYDKYINKIITEYDRLIVENFTAPKLDNANVISIKSFEELLDVRDNLKLPILYYCVSKHIKCYFYIRHDNDIYLMTVKAVDLEGETNEKN